MDAETYAALRQRCVQQYPAWVTVVETVEGRLKTALRTEGIEAEVSARAKDVDSLLRKMVFKYNTDDLGRASDRAGARIVVHLPSEIGGACEVVRRVFDVVREENTADRYEADQFSYRGIHLDSRVPDPGIKPGDVTGDVICEVQVRTVAEHAWSVLSHLLTYKSPGEDSIPHEMRRRVNRLIAIVELFDQEARATNADITERPEYAVQRLVYDLERLHNRVVGDQLDSLGRCTPDLTEFLLPLYGETAPATAQLAAFADDNSQKLRAVVSTYDEEISPFVRQPEALMLWERLDFDPVNVAHYWQESAYPMWFLQNMATIWGVDLPED